MPGRRAGRAGEQGSKALTMPGPPGKSKMSSGPADEDSVEVGTYILARSSLDQGAFIRVLCPYSAAWPTVPAGLWWSQVAPHARPSHGHVRSGAQTCSRHAVHMNLLVHLEFVYWSTAYCVGVLAQWKATIVSRNMKCSCKQMRTRLHKATNSSTKK